ncbi:hypothetical protein VCRA2126O85_130120 [Vibrio crassostreae]|nr:hypothetical protein VCRA2113O415_250075 [Vibrio crassostreae]CAK2596357.1 hypothetical protein VCRA2128O100_120026 [Vibrio crassostreae]CAK2596998.1 hypothetical protein VCRA2126O84_120029 [Vibrio crassostreae]CAK2614466.1 hypothetical protein VCRA2125O83_130030 [Vibrio crassostreae]CAK2622961.1 hypothetical protein VCRA2127O91_130120 [Vibrio crassostreae]
MQLNDPSISIAERGGRNVENYMKINSFFSSFGDIRKLHK